MSTSFLSAAAVRALDSSAAGGKKQRLADSPAASHPPVPSSVLVEQRPGRGRGLLLAKPAAAGSTILAEAPVAWWVDADRQEEVCARCFKSVPFGGHSGCELCRSACWCSEECRAEDVARHTVICGILCAAAKVKDPDAIGPSQVQAPQPDPESTDAASREYNVGWDLDPEGVNLLTFCAHAVALRSADPPAFASLMALNSDGVALSEEERAACIKVAARLAAAGVSAPGEQTTSDVSAPSEKLLKFVAELCGKDKSSNMALTLEPDEEGDADSDDSDDSDEQESGDKAEADDDDDDDDLADSDEGVDIGEGVFGKSIRRIRGYVCYPTLAMCNHSCLPSAARFDGLDTADLSKHPVLAVPLSPSVCAGPLAEAAAAAAAAAPTPPSDGANDTQLAAAAPPLHRPPYSLATQFVALHALPAGSEVTISYMPLGDPLADRRQRLREEYSFACDCARCAVETADEAARAQAARDHDHDDGARDYAREGEPSAAEHDHEHGEDGCCDDGVGGCGGGGGGGGGGGETAHVDMTYLSLFVLKHVCGECLGTMAPVPSADADAACVCNRCGVTRTQAEFLERVEAHFEDSSDESD